MSKVKKTLLCITIASLLSNKIPNIQCNNNYSFNHTVNKPILVYANEKQDINIKDKTEFIKTISPIAIDYGRKYNLWPSLIIANAIQESEYGTISVSRLSNNLFNLKVDKDWKGEVSIYSSEKEKYRAYAKIDDSIEDFCKLIVYHSKYWPIAKAPNLYEALKFYEVGYTKDKNKDKELKSIIEKHELKQYDTSLYGNYKKKDAIKHPLKFLNKQIDSVKEIVESDVEKKLDSAKDAINKTIAASMNTVKASMIKKASNLLIKVFNLVTTSIIQTPSELVTSPQINTLYNKMLIVAIGISAIFIVCGCLSSIIDDSNISIFSIAIKGFKSIVVMLLSPIFIPIFVLWSNLIAKGFLSLGISQVGDNFIIESFLKQSNTGFLGVIGFFIIIVVLIIFLFVVFLSSCNRYWQVCKLYVLMPLALSTSVMPHYSSIYFNWKSKFKSILVIQCIYAIHLGIFSVLMSIPFSIVIKTMIFIGGIVDLARVPSSVEGLFSYNNNNSKGVARKAIQLAANIKGLKGGK